MKILKVSLLALFATFLMSNFAVSVYAGNATTVLPSTEKTQRDCETLMSLVNQDTEVAKTAVGSRKTFQSEGDDSYAPSEYTDILACAIRTGDIKLWMVPFYIRFLLEFVIGIAGLIAVGGVVYGGYLYLFTGLSEDEAKGKNAIKNGLIGLILILTAWAIVNIVITLVTL